MGESPKALTPTYRVGAGATWWPLVMAKSSCQAVPAGLDGRQKAPSSSKGQCGQMGLIRIGHLGFLKPDICPEILTPPYFLGLILPGVCACVMGECGKHMWACTH